MANARRTLVWSLTAHHYLHRPLAMAFEGQRHIREQVCRTGSLLVLPGQRGAADDATGADRHGRKITLHRAGDGSLSCCSSGKNQRPALRRSERIIPRSGPLAIERRQLEVAADRLLVSWRRHGCNDHLLAYLTADVGDIGAGDLLLPPDVVGAGAAADKHVEIRHAIDKVVDLGTGRRRGSNFQLCSVRTEGSGLHRLDGNRRRAGTRDLLAVAAGLSGMGNLNSVAGDANPYQEQ